MHMCVHVHMCMPRHAHRGRKRTSGVSSGPLPCLKQNLLFITAYAVIAGPGAWGFFCLYLLSLCRNTGIADALAVYAPFTWDLGV